MTNELLSMSFDDTYLPEAETFRQFFSADELRALALFNKFYDEQSSRLPDADNGVADWLKDETWQQIMRRASEVLTLFVR